MTSSKYQKRHYEQIAELLGKLHNEVTDNATGNISIYRVVGAFENMFREDNDLFDADRFRDAIVKEIEA